MSTRYNTGNPIESTDVRDMSDNAKNFDEFSNSMSDSFSDRLGIDRQTIEGSIRKAGFQPASFDFVTGGTLVPGDRNKAVFNPAPSGDNNWYAWQGAFPKIISPSSTPATSGGFGGNAWKPVTNNVLAPTVRENSRRSYAESGLNLVAGSFQAGFSLVNDNDVAMDETTGKCFSGAAGAYPAGTSTAWFTDRSYATRSQFIGERNLLEFIPRQYWSGVLDGTNTADMTTYIQNAVDSGEAIKQLRRLVLRLDSPLLFFGGIPYDFGGSILKPTDAFGVLQHKVFTSDEGPASGQHFTLRNMRIEGDPTKKYNKAGAGLKFNKDLSGAGYSVYDSTIENIVVKDMYYCFNDKGQSGAWMTTFKHVKGINCPVGFAKSIGTTITLQNVYMLGGHRGFELDNIYGMDMLGCAHDGATDYAPDFIDSRIEITNSEINMQTLRAEYLSANRRLINVSNSKVNIGNISLAHYSADTTANDVNLINIGLNSEVNIAKIEMGSGSVSGSNVVSTIAATGNSTVTTQPDVPWASPSNSLAISAYNSRVYGSRVPDSKISAASGYVEQQQSATLYINQSTGSDTNSGLIPTEAKRTLGAAINEINAKYRGNVVTIMVSGEVSLVGSNKVSCKKLTVKRNGSGSLVVVVTGGVAGRIYGPTEIIIDMTSLTFSGAPGSFANGIPFPSAIQDLDYSLDSIQFKIDTITLPANAALAGCVLFGYNGMLSVGARDSAITGAGVTSSYICYLSSGTAQITTGGGSITTAAKTNGAQISTSNLYYA